MDQHKTGRRLLRSRTGNSRDPVHSSIQDNSNRVLISRTKSNKNFEDLIVNSGFKKHSDNIYLGKGPISKTLKHKKVISGGKQIKTILRCDHVDDGPVWGASSAKRNLDRQEFLETDEEIKKRRIDRKIDQMLLGEKPLISKNNPLHKHVKVISDGKQLKTILRCDHTKSPHTSIPNSHNKNMNHNHLDVTDNNGTNDKNSHQANVSRKTIKSKVRMNTCNENMTNVQRRSLSDISSSSDKSIYHRDTDHDDIGHQSHRGRRVSFDKSCKYCQEDLHSEHKINFINTPSSITRNNQRPGEEYSCPGCIRSSIKVDCAGGVCTFCGERQMIQKREQLRECCHCCPRTYCSKRETRKLPHEYLLHNKEESNRTCASKVLDNNPRILRSSCVNNVRRNSDTKNEWKNCKNNYSREFKLNYSEPHECVHQYHYDARHRLEPSLPDCEGESKCLLCGQTESSYSETDHKFKKDVRYKDSTNSSVPSTILTNSNENRRNIKMNEPSNNGVHNISRNTSKYNVMFQVPAENVNSDLKFKKVKSSSSYIKKASLISNNKCKKRDSKRSFALDDHL